MSMRPLSIKESYQNKDFLWKVFEEKRNLYLLANNLNGRSRQTYITTKIKKEIYIHYVYEKRIIKNDFYRWLDMFLLSWVEAN